MVKVKSWLSIMRPASSLSIYKRKQHELESISDANVVGWSRWLNSS